VDASAFPEFLRLHSGLMHRVAYAYGRDVAEREDLVQEIAVQLWRSRDRYDERRRASTWVYRVALNVAISHQRTERRHRERRVALDGLSVIAPQASESGPELERLWCCIEALAPLEKALVVLYLDGNEHAAIAEVLGISVSNVGTKLSRIKSALREALERMARSDDGERHAAG
jgi:RNA polymerase sigma-70 factor (ECF subfamily)